MMGRRGRAHSDVVPTPAIGTVTITASGIVVRRGEATLVDGVTLEAQAGEILALVGPNGAGKTTLLGVLAGDNAADEGVVELFGRPLSAWSSVELARRRAVLPQHSDLSFPFSVRDVVSMGRAPWPQAEPGLDAQIVEESMVSTSVEHLAERSFTSLSGGEQSRVALARVLAQRAPVLLLDEPTASLDLHHQELVLQIARTRAAAGDTVIVVLHDLGSAAAYADQVAVLERGKLIASGPPDDVLTAARLSAVYAHPVDVFAHPVTGAMLVLPHR